MSICQLNWKFEKLFIQNSENRKYKQIKQTKVDLTVNRWRCNWERERGGEEGSHFIYTLLRCGTVHGSIVTWLSCTLRRSFFPAKPRFVTRNLIGRLHLSVWFLTNQRRAYTFPRSAWGLLCLQNSCRAGFIDFFREIRIPYFSSLVSLLKLLMIYE